MIEKLMDLFKSAKTEKAAFFSALITGMIVHLYMITNKLPNHDDFNQFYKDMDRTTSGRWFLKYPAALSGDLSIPFGGVLAIVYIALAAAIIVSALKVKNSLCAGIIAAIMMVFPTVACTMAYMNDVDAYFMSLMFVCIAVYLGLDKRPLCWFAAVVFLALSLGIYQAYFPFAICMFVIAHIKMCLSKENENKEIILSGIKSIVILVSGLVLYFIVVKITTMSGIVLTSYAGINDMGKITLASIPKLVGWAYTNSIGFFAQNLKNLHYSVVGILFLVCVVLTFIGIPYLIKKVECENKGFRVAICIFACVILPLGAGFIFIMAKTGVHMLMVYAYSSLIILPIIILDLIVEYRTIAEEPSKLKRRGMYALEIAALCLSMTLVFNYSIRSNQYYFTLDMAKSQSEAFATMLMSQIRDMESYTTDKTIVLVGTRPVVKDSMPWMRGNHSLKYMTGVVTAFDGLYSYQDYLYHYMDIDNQIAYITSNGMLQLGVGIDNLYGVPVYPDNGSILEVNDMIIVKLSEVY